MDKISKQDANTGRNLQDLKKYFLNLFTGMKKNIETSQDTLTKVENELNNFVISTVGSIADLKKEIDGKVTTWYYSGEPKLTNEPANEWTTDEDKEAHTGDLYYDKATGYTYIFQNIEDTYQWTKIKDEDIVQAMALANSAKDTADSKRRVFVEQPTPPYDNGDLWIKDKEIYICQISKTEDQPYQEQDFIIATKYTDDTVANAIVDEMGGTTTKVLNGQVVIITKSFAKFTDLADPTSSTTIAGEHITTGNIKSNNYIQDVSGTKINLEDGTIDTKNFKVDENGNISLYNGAKVIGENGLMTSYMQSEEGFIGYALVDPGQPSNEASKTNVLVDIIIPEGFEITKAKIIGYHTPIFWGYQDINYVPYTAWGYARGLKLYKATNMYSKKMTAQLFSEYEQEGTTEYEEIKNALGENGWTASVPNDFEHNTEKFESLDIKSIFEDSKGTVPGLYQIKLESEDNPSSRWGTLGVVQRSGHIKMILVVEGYMTYGNYLSEPIISEEGLNIITEDEKSIYSEGER